MMAGLDIVLIQCILLMSANSRMVHIVVIGYIVDRGWIYNYLFDQCLSPLTL